MSPFVMPLYLAGLYRLFRRMDGVNYGFLGVLFLFTLVMMYVLLTPARMLAALFMPLLAAGAVLVEELLARLRRGWIGRTAALAYLLVTGVIALPLNLPILPPERMEAYADHFRIFYQPLREFNVAWHYPPLLTGRLKWDELVQGVAGVYDGLPPQERPIAGIYADWYPSVAAVDLLGPAYGLPHGVSGFLTYYLWGPGYSWEVMLIIAGKTNNMAVFFDDCELKAVLPYEYDPPVGKPYIYVCRKPKVPAEVIWGSLKSYR
jgi:hypothetical protein